MKLSTYLSCAFPLQQPVPAKQAMGQPPAKPFAQKPGGFTPPEQQQPNQQPAKAARTALSKAVPIDQFIQGRMEGAQEIAAMSRQKGGLSILTAIHFEAKLPAYKTMLRLAQQFQGRDLWAHLHVFRVKASAQLQKQDLPMDKFQQLTGQLEAYGEVAAYLENPVAYETVARS